MIPNFNLKETKIQIKHVNYLGMNCQEAVEEDLKETEVNYSLRFLTF